MTKQELVRELKIARSALSAKNEETRVARATCGTIKMEMESLTDRIARMKDTSWSIAESERYQVLYRRANTEVVELQLKNRRLEAEVRRLSKRISKARGKGKKPC
jgi:uncharacterized protein YukE